MHELSIAQNIVDLVSEEAEKKNALRVSSVCLEIGELAGIEVEALNFAWDVVTQNTLLGRATLLIDRVNGKACCRNCGHEFIMKDFFDLCPICQSFENEITGGKELKIKTIEIEY